MASDKQTMHWIAKPCVWVLCLAPLAWLIWQWWGKSLGPNPIDVTNRYLGEWALRFLLIALAVTPLRVLFGNPVFVRFRRLLGLFAFAYVLLHLTSYIVLDQFFDWDAIWQDITKRWYITTGIFAFVILLSLAVTSTKGMVKLLGGARWNKLHKLVYIAAIAGVFHFYMIIRADFREPIIYGAILTTLLGYRIVIKIKKKRRATSA
jgi:sulfoxide reductase heme-binding subunit YedZ